MVIQTTKRMTVAEFEAFLELPKNKNHDFELIAGEPVEGVSNYESSETAANILIEIGSFVKKNRLGRVSGADGGFKIGAERYIPDVAFVSFDKMPDPSREAYVDVAPDLAVEVLSPGNDPDEMSTKIVNYLQAGVVWLFSPEKRRATVYAPGKEPQAYTYNEHIEGGDILPGFSLMLKDIFPEETKGDA